MVMNLYKLWLKIVRFLLNFGWMFGIILPGFAFGYPASSKNYAGVNAEASKVAAQERAGSSTMVQEGIGPRQRHAGIYATLRQGRRDRSPKKIFYFLFSICDLVFV
jgi:hypothetical protein